MSSSVASVARSALRRRGIGWMPHRTWASQAQERDDPRDDPRRSRPRLGQTQAGDPRSSVPANAATPRVVDTLEVMKRFEELGLSRSQAEALTRVVTDVLRQNIDALANTYVSNTALEMSELRAESSISGFRAEVMKIQELQEATSVRETERLQANLEKIKSEVRYEVDKLTASQRLELGLEKNRMRWVLLLIEGYEHRARAHSFLRSFSARSPGTSSRAFGISRTSSRSRSTRR
jgi:hypothetical protein